MRFRKLEPSSPLMANFSDLLWQLPKSKFNHLVDRLCSFHPEWVDPRTNALRKSELSQELKVALIAFFKASNGDDELESSQDFEDFTGSPGLTEHALRGFEQQLQGGRLNLEEDADAKSEEVEDESKSKASSDSDDSSSSSESSDSSSDASSESTEEEHNPALFLEQCHFDLFYGEGNSILFKVTDEGSGEAIILKVGVLDENVEALVQHGKIHTDPRLMVEEFYRGADAQYQDEFKTIELCPVFEKNLLEHAKDENYEFDESELLDFFEQMASILTDLAEKDILFTDGKITNWLLDGKKRVRVCDKKSFIDEEDYRRSRSRGLSSPGFNAPELASPRERRGEFTSDKTHAFILGKNIYKFISPETALFLESEEKRGKIIELNDASLFDFSNPFYESELGKEIKGLIERLVKPESVNRLSVGRGLEIIQVLSSLVNSETVTLTDREQELKTRYLALLSSHDFPESDARNHDLEEHWMNPMKQRLGLIKLIYLVEDLEREQRKEDTTELPRESFRSEDSPLRSRGNSRMSGEFFAVITDSEPDVRIRILGDYELDSRDFEIVQDFDNDGQGFVFG